MRWARSRARPRGKHPSEHPSPRRSFSLHSAHPPRPAPDAAKAQGLYAKSSPRDPPLRRAPPELREKWTQWAQWEAPLQPPPGMWTGRAASDYPEEWPVEWPVPEAGPRVPVTPEGGRRCQGQRCHQGQGERGGREVAYERVCDRVLVHKIVISYKQTYKQDLFGDGLGNFHVDFSMDGAVAEIYGVESLFLGKNISIF